MSGFGTGPEPLYQAPRNSISEPHGPHRGYNGQDRMVLVRLVLTLLACYTLLALATSLYWFPLAYCTKITNVLIPFKLN